MKITKREWALFLKTHGISLALILSALFAVRSLILLWPGDDCPVVSDMMHPIQWPPKCYAVLWSIIPISLVLPGLVYWLVFRSKRLIRHGWWILLSAVVWVWIFGLYFYLQDVA